MIDGFAKEHLHITEDLFHHIEKIDFEQCNDYFRFKSGGDGDNGEVLMDEIDDYFINAYKYRWHDLRKNPNDLPKDAEYVLVCWRGIKQNWYDVMFWDDDKKVFSLYGDHPVTSDERPVTFGDVIAWKYIEPLEVIEEL